MLDLTRELQEPGHASEISELRTARVKNTDTHGARFRRTQGKANRFKG